MEEIFRESWPGRARFPPQNSANKKKLIWFWKDGWIWRVFLGWNWMKLVFSPKVETPSTTPPGKICVLGWTSFLKLQHLLYIYIRRCAQSMDIWGLCTVFSFVKYWRASLEGQPWIITFSWIICPFVDHKTWIFEDDGDKHHPIIYLWWSQIHSDWFCIWLWAQLLYITFSDPPQKKTHTHTHG